MDPLQKMIDLALHHRLVRLTYRKAMEELPQDRLVEPYRLSINENSMIIQCWQAAPVVVDGAHWRWFRADRIVKVTDGGQDFIPRCRQQLSIEEVAEYQRKQDADCEADAVDKYFHFVEQALMDSVLSDDEMNTAKELVMGVPPRKLRVVHAHVYINVLNELLVDGELTEREEKHLVKIKKALGELGWTP